MNKPMDYFLYKYSGLDFVSFIRARILLAIIFLLVATLSIMLLTGVFFTEGDIDPGIVASQLLPLLAIIFTLFIFRAGHYLVAANITLILAYAAAWSTMISVSGETMLARLDTIIFIAGTLVIVPLLLPRRGVLVYNMINLAVFILFVKFIVIDEMNISGFDLQDYITDNTIAFIVIFVLTYLISYVNETALKRSEAALEKNRQSYQQLKKVFDAVQVSSGRLLETSGVSAISKTPISLVEPKRFLAGAACERSACGRPRTAAPCRPCARARADRRWHRPWSRGRRGRRPCRLALA